MNKTTYEGNIMKKTFKAQNISCINCANLIKGSLEDDFGEIEVNLATTPKEVTVDIPDETCEIQFKEEMSETEMLFERKLGMLATGRLYEGINEQSEQTLKENFFESYAHLFPHADKIEDLQLRYDIDKSLPSLSLKTKRVQFHRHSLFWQMDCTLFWRLAVRSQLTDAGLISNVE